MCNPACLQFIRDYARAEEFTGQRVLEAGARNVNGSARTWIQQFQPAEYIGTDLAPGPGVDQVWDAELLADHFKPRSFGAVISTEMLEHAYDWPRIISNFKRLIKPGGMIYLTTRSPGFIFHEYPKDYWRFTTDDMAHIFSDCQVHAILSDPSEPGVFVKVQRPKRLKELNLHDYPVYSITREQPKPVRDIKR